MTRESSDISFARFTDITQLESLVASRGVDALIHELRALMGALADDPPRREFVALLVEAVALERRFLKRHPESLFQSLWYRCWWYDCPQAAQFYPRGFRSGDPPLVEPLHRALETWRETKRRAASGLAPRYWLRSLRPPPRRLGGLPVAARRIAQGRALAFSPDGARVLLDTGSTRHEWSWREDQVTSHARELPRRPPRASLRDAFEALRRERGWRLPEGREGLPEALSTFETWTIKQLELAPGGRHLALFAYELHDAGDPYDEWRDLRLMLWSVRVADHTLYLEDPVRLPWREAFQFSPDGRFLVIANRDHVALYELASDAVHVMDKARGRVKQAAMSPDGRHVAACTDERRVYVWPVSAPRPRVRSVFAGRCAAPLFSPDGARLLTSPTLTDGRTGALVATIRDGAGGWGCEGGPPANARVISDSRIASLQTTVAAWDAKTGEPLALPDEGRRLHGAQEILAYAPDLSTYAVYRLGRSELRLLDLLSGAPVAKFMLPSLTCMEFSPDGAALAVAFTIPRVTVRVLDITSRRELGTFLGHAAPVTGLTFGRDGATLLSYAPNETLRLWDLASERALASRPAPDTPEVTEVTTRSLWYLHTVCKHALRPSDELLGELDGWRGAFQSPVKPSPWRATERDGLLRVTSRADDVERAWFPITRADSGRFGREPGSSPVPLRHPDGDIWAHADAHVKLERFA